MIVNVRSIFEVFHITEKCKRRVEKKMGELSAVTWKLTS